MGAPNEPPFAEVECLEKQTLLRNVVIVQRKWKIFVFFILLALRVDDRQTVWVLLFSN